MSVKQLEQIYTLEVYKSYDLGLKGMNNFFLCPENQVHRFDRGVLAQWKKASLSLYLEDNQKICKTLSLWLNSK